MKYIINQEFERIEDENKTILFTGTVEKVYILNEIETQILKLFDTPCFINETHEKFNKVTSHVMVKKEDYFDFVEQLIIRRILISSND